MKLNLSAHPERLRVLDGMVSISEYVYGPRIYVNVHYGTLTVYPDHKYNKSIGHDLSEDEAINLVEKHVTSFQLTHARTPKFWACFVYNDQKVLKGTKYKYRSSPSLIAVQGYLDDGTPMLKELSEKLFMDSGIPCNPNIFVGLMAQAYPRIPIFANTSQVSIHRSPAGIIVQKEPCEYIDSKRSVKNGPFELNTYYIGPSDVIQLDMGKEDPVSLVEEFSKFVNAKMIEEIHDESGISPIKNKIKFRRHCLNFLKERHSHFYNEYKSRAITALGDRIEGFDFDKKLYELIGQRVNDLAPQMERYSYQTK